MPPRWWRNPMMSMYYARIVALAFVLIGLVGFTNITGWAWVPSLYHLCLGLFFGYAGFFVRERDVVLQIIEGLGILLVVVKGITLLVLLLLREPLHWGSFEISCFVVGIGSIVMARYLRGSEPGGGVR